MNRIDTGRYGSILDLRQVSPANLSHVRQMGLRQTALSTDEANPSAKTDWERYCHTAIISFIVSTTVRYLEQWEAASEIAPCAAIAASVWIPWGQVQRPD
jgi:hypothetical protein